MRARTHTHTHTPHAYTRTPVNLWNIGHNRVGRFILIFDQCMEDCMVNLVPRFVIVTSMLRHLVFSQQLVRFKRLCKLLFSFFTMPKKTMKATKAMKAMKAMKKAKVAKTPAFEGALRLRKLGKAACVEIHMSFRAKKPII